MGKETIKPMPKARIVWEFIAENPGCTATQIITRFKQNETLTRSVHRLIHGLKAAGLVHAVEISNPDGTRRKRVSSFYVTADAYQGLPSRRKRGVATSEVAPAIPAAQPKSQQQAEATDVLDKPINALNLKELREAYGFLKKLFT